MFFRVTATPEALATVTTRVIFFFQVNCLQVSLHASLGSHDGAAQATHPLAAGDRCEAILDR